MNEGIEQKIMAERRSSYEYDDLLTCGRGELGRHVAKHAAGFHDGLHLPAFASYLKPAFALFLCNA